MESSAVTTRTLRRCGVALTLVAGFVVAAPAQAATTIGSSLAARPNLVVGCGIPGEPTSTCTVAQIDLPDRPVTAPTDGVIVRWRLRAAAAGSVAFRVLRPEGNGRFSGAGTSTPITLVAPTRAGEDRVYSSNTRLPVQQGDYIGLDRERRAGAVYAQRSGSAFELIQFDLRLPDGDPEGPDTSHEGVELLLNADLEVDKDGDGFGDETQDNCPSIANDQRSNPCPSDPIGPGDPSTGDPGTEDGQQFRRHRSKKRGRPRRPGRRTQADRFRSHR